MISGRDLPDAVRARIEAAFSFLDYPGDDRIVPDESDPESREVADSFRGKRWKDMPLQLIRQHSQSLPLFTPLAFRYYLPAFMCALVDSYYDADILRDTVLFNLTPPPKRVGPDWDFFWARANQFRVKEIDAICSFLELMDQYDRADWASTGIDRTIDRVEPAASFWAELA
jgi:hypothetical protein